VEEVARLLGTSATQVRKLVRPYKLLKYAIELKGWTDSERKILEDEKLKPTAYTRLFTLSRTKEILQVHFDEEDNIVSALPDKVFKEQMKRVVRDFLIPDPETGKPRCDTRTNVDEYFSAFLNSSEGKAAAASAVAQAINVPKPASATSGGASASGNAKGSGTSGEGKNQTSPGPSQPKAPKASVFFENLECHVRDDNLIRLTNEIRRINHQYMTISGSLLTRAIFECALVYKIKAAKKWGELIKSNGKDPMLSDLIKFASNFSNGVFAENNICKVLQSHTTVQAKNYLDAMTHLKYQNADAATLQSVANNLRQVIQYILSGN
jgi:hypothetical protein